MACIRTNDKFGLINVKGRTCMDLSAGDNRSIIGFDYHGGPNQVWIFERVSGIEGCVYHIRSSGSGQYLSVEGNLHDGQKVVATWSPYAWLVEDEPEVTRSVRLLPATSSVRYCVDLSNYGSPIQGTPVELWGCWSPGLNQVWELTKP